MLKSQIRTLAFQFVHQNICSENRTEHLLLNPSTKIFVQKIEPNTCFSIRSPKYLFRKQNRILASQSEPLNSHQNICIRTSIHMIDNTLYYNSITCWLSQSPLFAFRHLHTNQHAHDRRHFVLQFDHLLVKSITSIYKKKGV